MVDFHARWHPLFMGAKGYVERGELGAPVMAYARLSDTIYVPTEMLTWSGQSGPEWFLFPHTMDVVRWLFGREPIEVYAKGYRGVLEAKGIACWDAIQAMVEFEGRAFCTFETSWIVPNSYTQRRRQPPVALWREGRPRAQERAVPLGLHRSLPHAVLVRIGDALRQGLGLPVRVDPLLRRLRRRRRAAGGRPAATA